MAQGYSPKESSATLLVGETSFVRCFDRIASCVIASCFSRLGFSFPMMLGLKILSASPHSLTHPADG